MSGSLDLEPVAAARLPDDVGASALAAAGDASGVGADDGADIAVPAPLTPEEYAAHLSLRDVVLRAYPDVVAELVQGETLADLLACVPTAQEAWQRVVATLHTLPTPISGVTLTTPMATTAQSDADLVAATTLTLPASAPSAAVGAVTGVPTLPGVASGSVVRSAQPGLEQMTPLARIRAGLRR